MTFMELLLSAKLGSTSAFEELFARYKNLLRKYSVVNGIFDEDLYPQYEKLYLMAFDRMLKERRRRERIDGSWGKGATAEEVFHWWMEDDFIPGQMSLEEFLYVC